MNYVLAMYISKMDSYCIKKIIDFTTGNANKLNIISHMIITLVIVF